MGETFLKWAGGKRWFVNHEHHRLPTEYNNYFEPFLGGGSVFFNMKPEHAYLNDINQELIGTYIAVRDEAEKVCEYLKEHERNHSKDYYYSIREAEVHDSAEKAARMIYLNKSCFNGIYRVNKKGKFNVPYGTDRKIVFNREDIIRSSQILRGAELTCQDFQHTIEMAQRDDFLFCAPPYTVINEDDRFIGYNADVFKWDDQIRLARALENAMIRGVKIIMTNVDHPAVRDLYEHIDGFLLDTGERSCLISGTKEGRKRYKELIVSANL